MQSIEDSDISLHVENTVSGLDRAQPREHDVRQSPARVAEGGGSTDGSPTLARNNRLLYGWAEGLGAQVP